jgi:histidinol-phosphate phosphatase family protein
LASDTYFIDIGIPEDYAKSQLDFAKPLPEINSSWTLFLDRDGVINQKIDNDYVRRPEDFHFLPGVLEAFPILSAKFGRIVIVTNQRGIGRGLFTEADLEQIHAKLLEDVIEVGGRIDGIYFCPHLADDDLCNCRKPKPGLAFQAMQTFPEIDLQKCILAGDSPSDISFGAGLGMFTIQISDRNHAGADLHYLNLHDFAVDIA